MLPYNKKLKPFSRKLRSSMTDAEIALWAKLRRKQLYDLQFYRQKPLGRFIVDFYSPSAGLIIEIDGGQHYTDEGVLRDSFRDAEFSKMGLSVLRFSNLDVLGNINGVIAEIVQYLEAKLINIEMKSP
jgi:very-short-patch-repair endonuclease